MPKYTMLVARFPFHGSEHPDLTDWLIVNTEKMNSDPYLGPESVYHGRVDDTPITMGRNRVLKEARDKKIDYVLMLDADMKPDLDVPGAKPFWDTSWEWMMAQRDKGPCVIFAPYCTGPPRECVVVFRTGTEQGGMPEGDNFHAALTHYDRQEAALFTGIKRCAAGATGVMLIDMRVIERLPMPWFYYEFGDPEQTHKASTEDVVFTRNLTMLGIPLFCNWDAWAGHWKTKLVSKPQEHDISALPRRLLALARREHINGHHGNQPYPGDNSGPFANDALGQKHFDHAQLEAPEEWHP